MLELLRWSSTNRPWSHWVVGASRVEVLFAGLCSVFYTSKVYRLTEKFFFFWVQTRNRVQSPLELKLSDRHLTRSRWRHQLSLCPFHSEALSYHRRNWKCLAQDLLLYLIFVVAILEKKGKEIPCKLLLTSVYLSTPLILWYKWTSKRGITETRSRTFYLSWKTNGRTRYLAPND